MKKTALTFGLFSLVIVATSFANPTTPNISNENLSIVPPSGGSSSGSNVGGGRKQDFHATNNEVELKTSNSNFSDINQSVGATRKLD